MAVTYMNGKVRWMAGIAAVTGVRGVLGLGYQLKRDDGVLDKITRIQLSQDSLRTQMWTAAAERYDLSAKFDSLATEVYQLKKAVK